MLFPVNERKLAVSTRVATHSVPLDLSFILSLAQFMPSTPTGFPVLKSYVVIAIGLYKG
jgi:hypothetical protein